MKRRNETTGSRTTSVHLFTSIFAMCALTTQAANIAWVSDASPAGFSGPGTELTDGGFVKLLQAAGHNVIRFNGPDAPATLLTPAELTALHTNDLVIISRAANSAAWQSPQGPQWNTAITKPLICMSPFLVRGPRMGWFVGDGINDDIPVPWTPGNASQPVVDYIFGTVAINGTNTAELFQTALDRNTSHIPGAPVAGGLVAATATYPREDNGVIATGNALVLLPTGAPVAGGNLAGPRMYFAAGTRESATAPNAIPLTTGRETLTETGEKVYLRAVEVMVAGGVAPSTNSGPVTIIIQPASVTVTEGGTARFFITAAGAAPRLIEWQRNDGNGGFTNIPGAFSSFVNGAITLPAVTLNDNGAQFRAVVSNSLDIVTSAVTTLTVSPDTTPLLVEWAASMNGTEIVVQYSAPVDPITAGDFVSYFTDMPGVEVSSVTVRPDGRSVTLALSIPMGDSLNLTVDSVLSADGRPFGTHTLPVKNLGFIGADVGALNPAPGSEAPAGPASIAVTAGGLDIASTADIMRLVSQTRIGDFDARVRVQEITGTFDHLESVAKAALVAREGTANNSPGVIVFVTPPTPGDERAFAHYRASAGSATNLFGPSVPLKTPNAWLRTQRIGDSFTTYSSSNGVDWVTFGTAIISIGQALEVGVAAVSHRNGKTVTATFSNLRVGVAPIDPVTIVNSERTLEDFRFSFLTAAGATYKVEYNDDLSGNTWTPTTPIVGDGTMKTFMDAAPASPQRFYRVVVE